MNPYWTLKKRLKRRKILLNTTGDGSRAHSALRLPRIQLHTQLTADNALAIEQAILRFRDELQQILIQE